MIDEAFDTELEARLRATLDEMIPKLVASRVSVGHQGAEPTADVVLTRRVSPRRGSRHLAVAAMAVAATVFGLIAIATRDTGNVAPGDTSPSVDAGPPAWYDLIAPSLPERFQSVALTFATDEQMWFVAINPIEGKTLEIQLASGGYSAEPTTTVDATGDWVETAQGWSVRTPAGLFVSVSCTIGLGGREFVGTTNYCDFTSGTIPFTRDEMRAVANTLATTLDVSIFDQNLGEPSGDTIETAEATALIATALPGQQISATDLGNGADHIYNVGPAISSQSDTLPAAVTAAEVNTSIRILHGVLPSSVVSSGPVINGYDDAWVVSMFGSGGVYVRISTRDSSQESVTRLSQLARALIKADPSADGSESPTINTILATTTTLEAPTTAATLAGETTTTLEPCADTDDTPVVVLVLNASHVNGAAKMWTNQLSTEAPTISFAEPLNAIAEAPTSRVLGLNGFECSIARISDLTTGTADAVPIETLQALVAEPLPIGTSIVVVIGNDSLSEATFEVTTTSATP